MMIKKFLSVFPFVLSLSFGQNADPGFGFGNQAIIPDSFPGIVGVNTNIDVVLSNFGTDDTTNAEVELSYNDWGVTYMRWQPIGTKSYSVVAGGDEDETFSYVFQARAHTCLQAIVTNPGPDGNLQTFNDRAQINWEVVHCEENCDMYVPFGNGADGPIEVGDVRVECLNDAAGGDNPLVPCEEILRGEDAPRFPQNEKEGPPKKLDANEVQVARLRIPFVPNNGPDLVVVVLANMNGEENNVMINVVGTTVEDLLNEPHLCCLESVALRVKLESILAEVLMAYENKDCHLALELLSKFVQQAILHECDLSDEEIACLEKAALKMVDVGIMIAHKLGKKKNKDVYIAEAHFFRRNGLYEAALLEAARAC